MRFISISALLKCVCDERSVECTNLGQLVLSHAPAAKAEPGAVWADPIFVLLDFRYDLVIARFEAESTVLSLTLVFNLFLYLFTKLLIFDRSLY